MRQEFQGSLKHEPSAGERMQFVRSVRKQLEEEGLAEDNVGAQWLSDSRSNFFRTGTRTRTLQRMWQNRDKAAVEVQTLGIGRAGGIWSRKRREAGKSAQGDTRHPPAAA